ncbi:MAG: hypothetical protein KAJ66_01750 [Candidatus Omnitrophica bacterium]|nr:hypothetical protein [Candidatus Omnitrophota bacterium]
MRIRKQIFPGAIALSSLILSIVFYNSPNSSLPVKLILAGGSYFLSHKAAIFYFTSFISAGCLLFFYMDILYQRICKKHSFYYYREGYLASNFLLLILLSYHYGVVQYGLGKAGDISTCFSPFGSLSFFAFIFLMIRVILKSGSRPWMPSEDKQ